MIARLTLVTLLSVAATVARAETPDSISKPPTKSAPYRSLSAIRTDVITSLKAEATTRRTGSNAHQVLRLIGLFREMASHPDRDTSATLKKLGLQVKSRLVTVRDRIERQITRSDRSPKNQAVQVSAAGDKSRVLAQQLPPAGGAPAGQAVAVTGIPSSGAATTDYGPELVELIQATISPASWNINGGNSAIVYYAPLRVLVVSAPSEIHAQVGGALQQLHAVQQQRDGVQVVAEVGAVRAP